MYSETRDYGMYILIELHSIVDFVTFRKESKLN